MQTKFCNRPGCPATIAVGERLCPNHRARNYRQQDAARPSADERGYDADWRRFRRRYLSQHPLCHDCGAEGLLTLAEEVHHVVKVRDDPARRLDPSNTLGLCRSHHSKRTMKGE